MRNSATTGKRVGYGWLYNWPAVNNAAGLAPEGWNIISDANREYLTNYIATTYPEITSTKIGGSLKSTRNEWVYPNTLAIDLFSFAGLPGGYRTDSGNFSNLRYDGYFWTSTSYSTENAYFFRLHWFSGSIYENIYTIKMSGFSVRCIQNKEEGEVDGDTGTLTDIEGNVYKWVVIGNYRWMAENLRTTKYKDGTSIPEVTDNTQWSNNSTGARCAYNNDHYFVYPPQR